MYVTPFYQEWINFKIDTSNNRAIHYDFGERRESTVTGFSLAINQCKYLYETYNRSLAVTLSGGVDSQAVLLAAHHSGVPLSVYSLRFNNNLNSHDLKTAADIASRLHVKINYIDIDIIRFYSTGTYLTYISQYRNSSPQIAAHLWLYDQIKSDTNLILASANPVIRHGEKLEGINNFTLLAWERFAKKHNVSIIGCFFWYMPELFWALYRSFNEEHTSAQLYDIKCDIYKRNGFTVIPQEQKYTGFEHVKNEFCRLYPSIKAPFDTLFRYSHESTNNMLTSATGL